MRVQKNNKLIAAQAMRLFISAAFLPISFDVLSLKAVASDVEAQTITAQQLGENLKGLHQKFHEKDPVFSFSEIEVTTSTVTAERVFKALPLKEGAKNMGYLQHALKNSLGSKGQEEVNKILSFYYNLATKDQSGLNVDLYKSLKLEAIFGQELERMQSVLTEFNATQEKVADEIISIIMNSCLPKTVISGVENATSEDAKAVERMFLAFWMLRGQHNYIAAFQDALDNNKKEFEQLHTAQLEAAKQAKIDLEKEKEQKKEAFELAKKQLEGKITAKKRDIELEKLNTSSPLSEANILRFENEKTQLEIELTQLESANELFLKECDQKEAALLEDQKQVALNHLKKYFEHEKLYYSRFATAFEALGRSGLKWLSRGWYGTRETDPVWGQLDVCLYQLKEKGVDVDTLFQRVFVDALDRFTFTKTIQSTESDKPITSTFTTEDMLALKGVDLDTMKSAVLNLFDFSGEAVERIRAVRLMAEKQRLMKSFEEQQRLNTTLTHVSTLMGASSSSQTDLQQEGAIVSPVISKDTGEQLATLTAEHLDNLTVTPDAVSADEAQKKSLETGSEDLIDLLPSEVEKVELITSDVKEQAEGGLSVLPPSKNDDGQKIIQSDMVIEDDITPMGAPFSDEKANNSTIELDLPGNLISDTATDVPPTTPLSGDCLRPGSERQFNDTALHPVVVARSPEAKADGELQNVADAKSKRKKPVVIPVSNFRNDASTSEAGKKITEEKQDLTKKKNKSRTSGFQGAGPGTLGYEQQFPTIAEHTTTGVRQRVTRSQTRANQTGGNSSATPVIE